MPLFKKKQKKVTTYSGGKEVPEKVPELEVPLPSDREKIMGELERATKMAEYHFKNGYDTAMKEKNAPPVEIEPPTSEPDAQQQPEIEIADYFETVREQGFIEGLSFAISTLRQAQNDIIRRQKER